MHRVPNEICHIIAYYVEWVRFQKKKMWIGYLICYYQYLGSNDKLQVTAILIFWTWKDFQSFWNFWKSLKFYKNYIERE